MISLKCVISNAYCFLYADDALRLSKMYLLCSQMSSLCYVKCERMADNVMKFRYTVSRETKGFLKEEFNTLSKSNCTSIKHTL